MLACFQQKLYFNKPNEIDTQQMEAWIAVMEQAHCNWIRYAVCSVASLSVCLIII